MTIRNYVLGERFTPANFNTYSLNNGLKYVTSHSVTGTNGFEVYGCFTSEFNEYRIMFTRMFQYSGAVVETNMRLTTGTNTPYTGASYYNAGLATLPNATASVKTDNGATSWSLARLMQSGLRASCGYIDLSILPTSDTVSMSAMMVDASSTVNVRAWSMGGFINNKAIYTGFTCFSPSVSIYGDVTVYGYRKS